MVERGDTLGHRARIGTAEDRGSFVDQILTEFMDDGWAVLSYDVAEIPNDSLDTNKRMLELYADSYKTMSGIGDGMVLCSDVAYDIRNNMIKQLV